MILAIYVLIFGVALIGAPKLVTPRQQAMTPIAQQFFHFFGLVLIIISIVIAYLANTINRFG